MCDGFETKLVTDYLKTSLENRVIIDWVFHDSPDGFSAFKEALPLMVEEVSCKGRLIYIVVYNEHHRFYIFHTLPTVSDDGWQTSGSAPRSYSSYLKLDSGEFLYLRPMRNKGNPTFQFISEERIFTGILDKLGPDILTEEFSLQFWSSLMKEYSSSSSSSNEVNITSFLTNQSIISGCGPIVKCESLYYANISPLRTVGSLTDIEREKLFEGLRIISRCGYASGGVIECKVYEKEGSTKTKTPDGKITYWNEDEQI